MSTATAAPMLSGAIIGANRTDIIARVKKAASDYFQTGCVVVALTAERIEGDGFAADYTARIFHDVEGRTYGPGICRGCGQENWPQHPLNAAKEWS